MGMGKRDLITKDFALYVVHYYNSMLTWSKEDILGEIDIAIKEAKPVDAVSRGCHDQVRWERDVAMEQLKDHGIPFGGIAPDVVKVVRCKDCKHYMTIHCTCDGCCISDDWYCADGERKSNE